jgi:hypothetical protein
MAAAFHSELFKVKVKVIVILRRFTANHFILAPSPLRPKTGYFLQLNPCGNSPYVNILSDEKLGLSLMNMLGLSLNSSE